jgi:hypothetical protein
MQCSLFRSDFSTNILDIIFTSAMRDGYSTYHTPLYLYWRGKGGVKQSI